MRHEMVNFITSNLPDFYNFYKILGEAEVGSAQDIFKRQQAAYAKLKTQQKQKTGGDVKITSEANRIVTISRMKQQISGMSAGTVLCIQGSPGQGKTQGINQVFQSQSKKYGKTAVLSTQLFDQLAQDYGDDDEGFGMDLKKLCKIITSGNKTPKETGALHVDAASQDIKNAAHLFNLLRVLIKGQRGYYSNQVADFFEKYIINKYYIYNEFSPDEDTETLAGMSSLLADENPLDGSRDSYSAAIKGRKWYPFMILNSDGAMFFDEITRFPPKTRGSLITFLTTDDGHGNRMLLQQYPVSGHLRIVAAGNFKNTAEAQALPKALQGRMEFRDLNVTPDDFYEFFTKKFSKFSNISSIPESAIPDVWSELREDLLSLESDELSPEQQRREQMVKRLLDRFSTVEKIDPNIFRTAATMAFDKFKWLVYNRPQLFMEDKSFPLSYEQEGEEQEGEDLSLTRKGFYNIKQDPSQKDRIDTARGILKSMMDDEASLSENPEEDEKACVRHYSQNRLLLRSFVMYFIPMEYVMQLRIQAAMSDEEGGEEGFPHAREYNDLYRNSLQGARELGSQRWAQSVTDVFENFHYSNQTFRNLVSRASKEIQDPASLFGSEDTGAYSQAFSKDDALAKGKINELGGLKFQEFIREYRSTEQFTEDSPCLMDFAILVNSLKYYFETKTVNTAIQSRFKGMISEMKGTTDESKKKYVEFMLDYAFNFRPKDAFFLFTKIMFLNSKVDRTQKADFEDFLRSLQSRENYVTDEEIAAAELEVPIEKRPKGVNKPVEGVQQSKVQKAL